MSKIKVEESHTAGDGHEKKVILDNTPDLNDKTGEIFLDHLEEAVRECRKIISEGYRLVDFWSDPDQGIQFSLKKKKK
jgi:hypothetical protein